MIQSKELRIGNLVKCKESNDARVYSVVAIDGMNCKIMLSNVRFGTWYNEDYVEPIPLAEELLLNECGYKKHNDYGSGEDYYQGLVDLSLEFCPTSSDRNYDSIPIDGAKEIKYLHELQNLIFAITGEELDVKF